MSQLHRELGQILNNWAAGQTPTPLEWQQLVAETLASPQRAKAFGITPANVEEIIQARANLFQAVYPDVLSLLDVPSTLPPSQGENPISQIATHLTFLSLWNLWLPLAMQLASFRQQLGRPLIQGILGGQGTGKTTLAAEIDSLSLRVPHPQPFPG